MWKEQGFKMKLITQKQMDFMDELDLGYDDDMTCQEASEMISSKLEELEEAASDYDAECYGDK
jgi:hypothetical protein